MRRLDDSVVFPKGQYTPACDIFRPARAGSLKATLETISLWCARARQRRRLRALDEHRLQDIGVSRNDALREAGKPFWRP